MTSISFREDPLTDVTATSSIFEMLFKSKESQDNPQEDDEPVSTQEKEPEQQILVPVKQPTLLADLHLLQLLTQQLQAATLSSASNNHDDDNERSNAETENLATLYCRRAAALLAFVDYDATIAVPVDILTSDSSVSCGHDEANQLAPMLEAVRQALQDSQAAVALTSNKATLAEAHLLSAYCSRSLGELTHARASTALAAAALPGSTTITSLAQQLDVEAHADNADLLPKLRMTSAAVSTLATSSVNINQHQEEENNNNQPEQSASKHSEVGATASSPMTTIPTEQNSFWSQVLTYFQLLEEAAQSSWLEKTEQLMHQNVHHRCAQPNEVRQLDTALQAGLTTLALLLQSGIACSALGLDMTNDAAARTIEKLAQTASSSPQTLVQNRTARKWIVEIWAPAVRRAVMTSPRSPLTDLPSDVLLMLSRLLQASGSWRRCTAMPHNLAYAEMGYDLAKTFRGNFTDPSVWTRLEMQCAEAYATALLQRTSGHSDALKIFRETLQAALQIGDQKYELRSRLHVARTLRLMKNREVAHAELVQLLERSRALHDVYMEAMAEYELGEHFVQQEDLASAQEHFRVAQTLCNRTANCGNSWRPQSIQQAIVFYGQLRPTTRRGAMRCSVATLLQPVHDQDNFENEESEIVDNDTDKNEQEEELQRPNKRRQAFYIKQDPPQPRSLMAMLINSTENSLSGPKPTRTLAWRESVFATIWPDQSTDIQATATVQ